MRRSRKKIISLHASIAPKNFASALESVADLCILENQRARHPWKKKRAPDAEKRVDQFEPTPVLEPIASFGRNMSS